MVQNREALNERDDRRFMESEAAPPGGSLVTPDLSTLQTMEFQAAYAALSSPQTSNTIQWALSLPMNIFKMMQTSAQPKPPTPKPKNRSTIITLIRPKGVSLPEPPPRLKKPKKKPDYLADSALRSNGRAPRCSRRRVISKRPTGAMRSPTTPQQPPSACLTSCPPTAH